MPARVWGLFATVATALLLVLSTAAGAAEDGKPRFGEFIPVSPRQPAPEVGFTDLDGNPADLAGFKGKPTIVNLWATWCEPCLREMPSLERLQVALDGKLVVAAVSQDRGGEKAVRPYLAKLGLEKARVYLDPKSNVGRAFGVRGLPTSIVLDASGHIAGRVEGAAEWDSDKMRAALKPLM